MLIGFKLLKSNTWEEFIAHAFLYSKLGILILFFFSNHLFAIIYATVCSLVFFFLRQPIYRGKSMIYKIREADQLFNLILGY